MSNAVVLSRAEVGYRLCGRFPAMSPSTVRQCVDDLWACCQHLGVHPDIDLIERLADIRLTGIAKGRRTPTSSGAGSAPGARIDVVPQTLKSSR